MIVKQRWSRSTSNDSVCSVRRSRRITNYVQHPGLPRGVFYPPTLEQVFVKRTQEAAGLIYRSPMRTLISRMTIGSHRYPPFGTIGRDVPLTVKPWPCLGFFNSRYGSGIATARRKGRRNERCHSLVNEMREVRRRPGRSRKEGGLHLPSRQGRRGNPFLLGPVTPKLS